MSLSGFMVGLAITLLSLFLFLSLPVYLTDVPGIALDVLRYFLILIGVAAPFIGAMSRG